MAEGEAIVANGNGITENNTTINSPTTESGDVNGKNLSSSESGNFDGKSLSTTESGNTEGSDSKNAKNVDPELFCCLLQPASNDSDPDYIGIRRLLLYRKAQSGVHRRLWLTICFEGLEMQRERIRELPKLHSPAEKLGTDGAEPPKHSGKQGNLLVDASVADGFRLQARSPSCMKWKAGPLAGTCEVETHLQPTEQVSARVLVIAITCAIEALNLRTLLLECTASLISAKLLVNNNFLSVGNSNKEVNVFNFSTGRVISKAVFDDKVTSMDHDHTGQLIFCGDARGCIYSVSMNSRTGALSRSHRHRSNSKGKSPITTVQYRSFSLLARGPVLLACTQDGSLSFFSVALEIQGYLTLRCSLTLTSRLHSTKVSFCPLLSLEKGEYIVAGNEDSNVYFYDLTRPKHMCVNKLQGHRFPAICVAWNHGENLLATSDLYGIVIVWKRAKSS
ncbi:hypothetical protein Tsubulata_006822 [Turnera subulata]|uniref:Uncharacterized protein n=1 Tax=Turnera subulata TaxID=218843 RepID=A0A9Q0J2S3_9ROSI|nr:hypothetical protein Tsubulata_006822 [Turnera subulata]